MLYLQIEFINMAQKAKQVTLTFQIVPSAKWIHVPYVEEERGLPVISNIELPEGQATAPFTIDLDPA